MRILLADDHLMVRHGLRAVLEQEGFTVVGEAADGREAVQLACRTKPDVAVLDIVMPGMNGIDAAREIRSMLPCTRVVLVSMHNDHRYVLEAVRSGISGYVLKTAPAGTLIDAIRQIARGNTYLSAAVAQRVFPETNGNGQSNGKSLTTRERQVLQLIAEGNATKQVAGILGLSVKTAESHRARIMDKLNIHDTANLVRYAIRHGIIEA